MSRDVRLYLEDILESSERVLSFCEGQTKENVFGQPMRSDAVLYNLQIIGEAVKKLPEAFRQEHPGISWREIAGMRDFIAHAYFALDLGIIWSAIREDVPRLRDQVQAILKEESDSGR